MRCRAHGPTVAQVPWARHGAGHTRDFDDQAAWLAVHVSKSAVVELLRVAWRTVGAIVARVSADIDARSTVSAGLRRIGIDEISYKRGFNYLTVVVDHDTGRLVWAAPGRDDATWPRSSTSSVPERSAALTHVSADLAPLDRQGGRPARAPQAVRCADPFHVVAWAIEALDVERRRAWNEAAGRHHRTAGLDQQRRRAGPHDQTCPLGAVEEPRTPHRAPTPPARLDRQAPTPDCGAPTCSKKDCATSSPSKATRPRPPSTTGSAGPDDHASPPSSSCNDASSPTAPRSTPPSTPACPTPSPNRPTPRSGSSPASPSASTDPTPLIALAMLSLGGHTPPLPGRQLTHGYQQESPISRTSVTRSRFATKLTRAGGGQIRIHLLPVASNCATFCTVRADRCCGHPPPASGEGRGDSATPWLQSGPRRTVSKAGRTAGMASGVEFQCRPGGCP